VQPAGDLVRVVVELAARVQDGHDDLGRRALFGRVHVDRDAAAVVHDGHRIVDVNRDVDVIAETGLRLVDTVVDDLVHQMVQPPRRGVADVHGGSLADRLETLENLDLRGVVGLDPVAGTDLRFSFHRLVSLARSHHPAPNIPQSTDGIATGNVRS